MDKWADYCIAKVRYTPQRIHIDRVIVKKDQGDTLGSEETWTRTDVVSKIKSGTTFVTVLLNSNTNKYAKGQPVQIISINGVEYIRTDANSKAADNLENLPEF